MPLCEKPIGEVIIPMIECKESTLDTLTCFPMCLRDAKSVDCSLAHGQRVTNLWKEVLRSLSAPLGHSQVPCFREFVVEWRGCSVPKKL